MKIINGNSLEILKTFEDNSVDSVVTDPPYGISFMGKKWDYDVPGVELWKEVLRVLKPGGHALVACGTRTQHRMAVNLEDAGFEIRDIVAWVYGSGFPKSLNIGKAVDKIQGNERIPYERPEFVARSNKTEQRNSQVPCGEKGKYTKGNSPYEGWGTALKPAMELWTLCRKPLEEKTVAENVLKYGTGGINIDGCRVGTETRENPQYGSGGDLMAISKGNEQKWDGLKETVMGRFPANLIHDGSDEVVELFPETKTGNLNKVNTCIWGNCGEREDINHKGSSGSASRFFKCCEYDTIDQCQDKNELTNVKCVENQQNNLETSIVQEVAKTKKSDSKIETSQVIQDYTGSCKECFQHQNNADVEKLESTDTTQTTQNHLKSCGCVQSVIDKNTNLDKKEKEVLDGEIKRFIYTPKASKSERNKGLDSIVSIMINYTICDTNGTQKENKVQLLVDMDNSLQKVTGVSGTESKNATEWNTMLFGNCTMEKFQQVNKSTTKTTTNLITKSTILNWLNHLLTNDYIANVNYGTENGGNLAENAENSNTLITTINEQIVSVLGVNNVVLGTQLKISVKEGSNFHSTVKPVKLMQYLCRLITPKGGIVLDPFVGSGSTGIGAKLEGFDFIGIEREEDYCKIAEARISSW